MRSILRFVRLSLFALLLPVLTFGQQHHPDGRVDLFPRDLRVPDATRQAVLREQGAWNAFVAAHPGWAVEFNESSGKPHRAFGPPIPVFGATPEEQAMAFITSTLVPFGVPLDELVHAGTASTAKYHFVHYGQLHQGLPVITGHLLVKLDLHGRVVQFGTAVHDGITLSVSPSIPAAQAMDAAAVGLNAVQGSTYNGLKVLPLPKRGEVDHRLVHELEVETRDNGRPGRWLSWVDAHSGELLYRWDQVLGGCTGHGNGAADNGADVEVIASVNGPTALSPTELQGLPDLRVTINGTNYFTDSDGTLSTGIPGPVTAQVQLRGRWSRVQTGSNTPSFTANLEEGPNTVNFNTSANIRQRSAYWFTNRIHAHLKGMFPTFTGMDFELPTKVDLTGGTCNAFYDGSSINFYAEGGGCRSLATCGDVVYHEYGHGINNTYYQSLGSNFINGGMNEGYADFWAFSLSEYPILAEGYQLNTPSSYIRRYDIDPKVYPQDLVGQVHADGEIIAGAWWDTYLLLGQNMTLTKGLFREAYPGLQANVFNGQEGVAYRNVLIDVLQADDDDGDITNGTPNGIAITQAFALHGITLVSNAQIVHQGLLASDGEVPVQVNATMQITFPFTTYLAGVRCNYRLNGQQGWNSVLMTNTGGANYSAAIPPQPVGTLISYYLAAEDVFGNLSSVVPVGAAQEDANLPFHILVGMELRATEDSDLIHELGDWFAGMPGDNATTGMWEQNIPVPSFSETGGNGVMVQPGTQTTPGGEFCYVTQNASSPLASMGEADVDGGSTTLASGNINLTQYQAPMITYMRWYVNNPPGGANPNADWWQVYVSANGGATWVPVEDTKTSDRSWRRNAFRVQDYVPITSTFRIKFIASDSIRPGQNLDGGSLVEAAVDDIMVWDVPLGTAVADALPPASIVACWPDPATDVLFVNVGLNGARDARIEVRDITGRQVVAPQRLPEGGSTRWPVDTSRLADGTYILRVAWTGGRTDRRFTVVR